MSEGGRLVVEKLVVVFMMGLIGSITVLGLGRGVFFFVNIRRLEKKTDRRHTAVEIVSQAVRVRMPIC